MPFCYCRLGKAAPARYGCPGVCLLLQYLSANLALFVSCGMNVEVPTAGLQVRELWLGERGFAFDRARQASGDWHDRRGIGARGSRSMKMRRGGGAGEAGVGDCVGHLLGRSVICRVEIAGPLTVVRRHFRRILEIGFV